jgi:hypothetical protein
LTRKLPIELKNRLVERAEAIAEGVQHQRNQASQLRNLLQIAQTETEVPVLGNFIRYQAARQSTSKFWQPIHLPVIGMLEEIGTKWAPRDPELRGLAIQHFFGYLIRAYVYLTSSASRDAGGTQGANRVGA